MTPDQLTDLLITRLLRDHGGQKHKWRKILGPLRLYRRDTHPHCNWAFQPVGSHAEIEKVESLADEMRLTHPIVAK
jgi:hypothetical protein